MSMDAKLMTEKLVLTFTFPFAYDGSKNDI